MSRAIILVMDSFGIGATADAARFGDAGSNTLGSIARDRMARGMGPLKLPNLAKLGLMEAAKESAGEYPEGAYAEPAVIGAYGFAEELSSGKDTPSKFLIVQGAKLMDWQLFWVIPIVLIAAGVLLRRLADFVAALNGAATHVSSCGGSTSGCGSCPSQCSTPVGEHGVPQLQQLVVKSPNTGSR